MRGGEHGREPLYGTGACIDDNEAVRQSELDEPHVVFERVKARRLGVHGKERSGTERRQYRVELGAGRDVLGERAIRGCANIDDTPLRRYTENIVSIVSRCRRNPLTHCAPVD